MIFDFPTSAAPTTTMTFTNNPETPYSREVIKHNTSVQMEDGSFYTYSRLVTNYRYIITVVLNTQAERDALETFYDSTVNGSEKSFTYTDQNSDEYTVRFEDDLKIAEIFKGRMYRAKFNLIQTT
tara:strand:+ start:3444 stop:3818 length:375 start_codon:yes stop_codon:yes gene_type:complete